MITIAVAAGATDTNYNAVSATTGAALAKVVDLFGIMAYDISGSWSETTGPLAPFGNCASGIGFKSAIAKWLAAGIPASQLLAGLPAYAISFYTSSATLETTTIGSQTTQYYQAWGGSVPTGSLGSGNWYYQDLVDEGLLTADGLSSGTKGYTRYWDACAGQPFLFNNKTLDFISYDDPQSLAQKAAYVKSLGLAGVMVFDSLGYNDNAYSVIQANLDGTATSIVTSSASSTKTSTTSKSTSTTTATTTTATTTTTTTTTVKTTSESFRRLRRRLALCCSLPEPLTPDPVRFRSHRQHVRRRRIVLVLVPCRVALKVSLPVQVQVQLSVQVQVTFKEQIALGVQIQSGRGEQEQSDG